MLRGFPQDPLGFLDLVLLLDGDGLGKHGDHLLVLLLENVVGMGA